MSSEAHEELYDGDYDEDENVSELSDEDLFFAHVFVSKLRNIEKCWKN